MRYKNHIVLYRTERPRRKRRRKKLMPVTDADDDVFFTPHEKGSQKSIIRMLNSTRFGPKIPAVGPFGGGFLFGLDKFGHLMVNMPYLPNFRSLEPPHGLEEAPVVH